MIKRLLYIFLVLMMASLSSMAKTMLRHSPYVKFSETPVYINLSDTTKGKKPDPDDKKKIKEIPVAKRQAPPSKLVIAAPADTSKVKVKVPRQRRPDGLVRPPEIPRHNNN